MSDETLISIVSISVVFGAPMIWFVVDTIASNWRKAKIAEHGVLLKREMIERGYNAEEIVRVLESGSSDSKKCKNAGHRMACRE